MKMTIARLKKQHPGLYEFLHYQDFSDVEILQAYHEAIQKIKSEQPERFFKNE